MFDLFDETQYQNFSNRLDQLSPDAKGQWGKMDAGQMLWHVNLFLEHPLNTSYKGNGKWLPRLFMRRMLLSEKPFKKNLPTMPGAKAVEPKDFAHYKQELQKNLAEFKSRGTSHNWPDHKLIGKMSAQDWSHVQGKHLDHHFRQFGV